MTQNGNVGNRHVNRRHINNDVFYKNIYDDYMANIITVAEIAKKYGVTIKTVYNVKGYVEKKLLEDQNQQLTESVSNVANSAKNNQQTNILQKVRDETIPMYQPIKQTPAASVSKIQDKYVIQPVICLDGRTRKVIRDQLTDLTVTQPINENSSVRQTPIKQNRNTKRDEINDLCERSWELYNTKYNPDDENTNLTPINDQKNKPVVNNKKKEVPVNKKNDSSDILKHHKSPRINVQTIKPVKQEPEEVIKKEKRKRIGQDALMFLENHRKLAEERDSDE